mgnify:FL=1
MGVLLISYLIIYFMYKYLFVPHTGLDNYIIQSLLQLSAYLLEHFHFDTFTDYQHAVIGINGSSGVNVGYACDGLSLFLLFSIFILVFPGRNLFKALYILIGCLGIHLLNATRIAALAIIHLKEPSLLHFHHTYTFTILIYGIIFGLWVLRMNIFNKKGW